MGTDIHVFVEKYNKEKGKWELVTDKWEKLYINGKIIDIGIYSERNYRLFGYLANVREKPYDENSIPAGIPEDISEELREYIDNDNYHSHTYFYFSDLVKWDLWKKKKSIVYKFYISVFYYILRLEDPWDYRLIICFDN